jgi:hypothetical protein
MMNTENLLLKLIIIFIIFCTGFLPSCRTAKKCPDTPIPCNLGSNLNTSGDDYRPSTSDSVLYYLSTEEPKNKKPKLFNSRIKKTGFMPSSPEKDFKFSKFQNIDPPAFFLNPDNNKTGIYFSAYSVSKSKKSKDIYYSEKTAGTWIEPVAVRELNSEKNDFSPSISDDGSLIVFASDRDGGFGESDIYFSRRLKSGKWSTPVNLGSKINSEKKEISPFLAPNGVLYYSSNSFGNKKNYDILKAVPAGDDSWNNPITLPEPYNTEKDEKDPIIYHDSLIWSSNRMGGCGGFDLYGCKICGDVIVEGKLDFKIGDLTERGNLELLSSNHNHITNISINQDGSYNFQVEPFKKYILKYSNECLPDAASEIAFDAPCSDSSTVKINIDFNKTENNNTFQFENYGVPLFVTGYYKPNTPENLEALKLLFEYNLLGVDSITKYIENPYNNYDNSAKTVSKAMRDAVSSIMKEIKNLENCYDKNICLILHINGFSDPRNIKPYSKYDDENISDDDYGFYVRHGEDMDNDLLSVLRAYYTAKLLEEQLNKQQDYQNSIQRIIWKVSGTGVNNDESIPMELRRGVSLKIERKRIMNKD